MGDRPDDAAVVVRFHRGRGARMVAVLVVLLVVALVVVATSVPDDPSSVAVGVVAVVMLGGLGWLSLRQLGDPRPLLVADAEGLRLRGVERWVGTVPWGDVLGIAVTRRGRQRYLGIALAEQPAWFSRFPQPRRSLLRLAAGMSGWTLTLPASAMSLDVDEVLEQLAPFVEQPDA